MDVLPVEENGKIVRFPLPFFDQEESGILVGSGYQKQGIHDEHKG